MRVIRTAALADLRASLARGPTWRSARMWHSAVFGAGYGAMLAAEVAAAGVSASSVVSEFTETTVAESAERPAGRARPRAADSAALDDFGNWFSPLSGLARSGRDILEGGPGLRKSDLAHSNHGTGTGCAINQ